VIFGFYAGSTDSTVSADDRGSNLCQYNSAVYYIFVIDSQLEMILAGQYKYILIIYTFVKKDLMKTLSLKLDDKIFDETEELTSKLKLARNRYINEAVDIYNLYNKRKLLKKQLMKESKLTSKDSMEILHEFEKLIDED